MKFLHRLLPLLLCVLFASARAAEESAAAGVPSTPPGFKIHRTTAVQYPVSLMREGISSGEARVFLHIDAEGRLVDTLVLAYTQKPFADAALVAIRQWRFEPARENGEAVGCVVDCSVRFEVDGVLLVPHVGPPVFAARDPFDKYPYKPHGLKTLDGIPTPIHVAQPIYPKEWIDAGVHGKVTIDFYIDETGAVRMPSVVVTDHPLIAAAAVAAVREWRFEAPRQKGKPVLAHCEQVFTFEQNVAKR